MARRSFFVHLFDVTFSVCGIFAVGFSSITQPAQPTVQLFSYPTQAVAHSGWIWVNELTAQSDQEGELEQNDETDVNSIGNDLETLLPKTAMLKGI